MKVVCAWCNEEIGEKEPLDDKSVTHGICNDCFDDINVPDPVEQLRRMKQKLIELDKKGVLWL